MQKSNKISEATMPEVVELINQQFINLGNLIGDSLLSLELQATQGKKAFSTLKIRNLFNRYAENGDEILNHYRVTMINELENLMTALHFELEEADKE